MTYTYKELNQIVDKYCEEHIDSQHIYVILRLGHTLNEMLKKRYHVEMLYYDKPFVRVWENDFYEGEQYIDVLTILNDDDILTLGTI